MKKIILLVLFAPFFTFSQVYNFDSDTLNEIPQNVTEVNGTIQVSSSPDGSQAMEAQTISDGNVAVFNMDLFPSSSDYSVTWKETYTVSRRDGFILRGSSSNTQSPDLLQGYLFQVNSSNGDARIYSSNASGYTSLAFADLDASGTNTPRWYKATANGNSLTLEYSTDGSTFIPLLSTTDTSYTTGNTKYTIGYSPDGVGGMFVDDVTLESFDPASGSISINNINPYQVIQRDASGNADILVEGVYTGTPTDIEARWNGSATWTIMDLDTNGAGTFSGTLVDQSQGQGLLEVRFSNDTLIINSIANAGIGDIYIIAGQSNASGRGSSLNNYTHGSLKAAQFGNNDTWSELQDAVDSNSGQIDNVSSDNATGSPWPLIATSILASQNIPIAFVPTPKGGSRISQWQPGADHSNASTLYGSMNRRVTLVGGNAKAILFFQGESDASHSTAQATYETELNTFINTAASDFTGLKTMVGQIGHSNYANNLVRAAQINVLHDNSNAILGPVTYDIDLSDEGGDTLHFKSDADMTEFARRWYKAIEKEFYSGTNGYGPIVDEANLVYSFDLNKITVPFTDDTAPVINSGSTVAMSSFDLKNNGVSISISSLAIVDNTIELTPSTALNIGQSITLSYASDNDGVNAAIYDNDNLPAENFYNLSISNITPIVSIWKGATNTDWATQTNWSANLLPTATDNIVIPNVTNGPVISGSTAAVANNITIDASATLSIQSGGSLIIDGTSTVNGDFIYNVDIGDDKWHLVSSPVDGEQYDDAWNTANNISTNNDNEAVASYLNTSDADGDWIYYQDGGAAATFGTGIGYSLKSDAAGNFTFIGTFPSAPVSVNITGNKIGDLDENKWNLVGNPVPAYINIATFLAENAASLQDTHEGIYIWNANSGLEGAYEAVTTGQIHPGQAFFVKSNVASTSVVFTTAVQSHQTGVTFYRTSNPQITVTIGDGTNTKATEINYLANKTTGLDPRFDIGSFTGQASSFSIYTHLVANSAGIAFTRQALPNSDYENMIIPIGVSAAIGKEITFTANDLNLPADIKIFLEDRETNTFTRLDVANSNYKMTTTEALNGIGRFYLHASRNSLNTKEVTLENVSVYKIDASTLRISGLQNGSKTSVTLFNLLGKQIVNTSLQSNGVLDVSLPKLATGVYFVKIQTKQGALSKKIILE